MIYFFQKLAKLWFNHWFKHSIYEKEKDKEKDKDIYILLALQATQHTKPPFGGFSFCPSDPLATQIHYKPTSDTDHYSPLGVRR